MVVGLLVQEMLTTVSQDVLQPARVSSKTEKDFYLSFSNPFWAP
jgi:hypothetical protein